MVKNLGWWESCVLRWLITSYYKSWILWKWRRAAAAAQCIMNRLSFENIYKNMELDNVILDMSRQKCIAQCEKTWNDYSCANFSFGTNRFSVVIKLGIEKHFCASNFIWKNTILLCITHNNMYLRKIRGILVDDWMSGCLNKCNKKTSCDKIDR
jgi:hypothetical protein